MKTIIKIFSIFALVMFVVGCQQANFEVEERVTYTVTFNPNGGTVSPSSNTVVENGTVDELPKPTKDGFIFFGWFTDNVDYTTEFTEETPVIENVEIFAKWGLLSDYQINYYVTESGDNTRDGLTEATAVGTIQHAVEIAKNHNTTNNSYFQYVINVSGSLEDDGTDAQSSAMISVSDTKALHITLKGISPYKTGTIDAQGHKRVLHVDGNNTTVVIDGFLTLTGGSAEKGGGVWVESGTLTLQGGSITGNTATLAGGGVFVDAGATLNLKDDPTISSNTVNTVNNNIEYYYSSEENRGAIFITGSLNGGSDSIGITSGSTNSKAIVIEGIADLSKDEIKKVLISDKNTAFFIDNNTIKETFITYIIEGEADIYGPYTTAQEAVTAIQAANSATPDKSYVLRIDGVADEGNTRGNLLYIYTTSNLTLSIQGLSEDLPGILKADGTKRVLQYDGWISADTLRLGENLTLTGGRAIKGGGILLNSRDTKLIIDGCTIIDNSAERGGGIFHNEGELTLRKGKIEYNNASDTGGGIYLIGRTLFSIKGGSISNNTAANNAGGVYIAAKKTLHLSGNPVIKYNTVDSRDNNIAYYFSVGGRGNIVVDAELTGNAGDIGIVSHNLVYGNEIIPESDYLTEQTYQVFKSDRPEIDFSLQGKALVAEGDVPDFSITYAKEGDPTQVGPFNSVQDAINDIVNKNDGSHYILTIDGFATYESVLPSDTALCVIDTSKSLRLTIKGASKQNPGIIDATGKGKPVLEVNSKNATVFIGENLTITGGDYGVIVTSGHVTMLEGAKIEGIYGGSAVLIGGGGRYTMDGGEIFNNYPNSQGGVIEAFSSSNSSNNSQFVLNGGTIFNNTLLDQSGVIRLTARDTANNMVTMNGGAIEHNGTGVYIKAYNDSNNIFIMKGGTIRGENNSSGSGIYVQPSENSSNIATIEGGNILNHDIGIFAPSEYDEAKGLFAVKGGNISGNTTGVRVKSLLLSGNPVFDNDTDIEIARNAEVYITGSLSNSSDIIINDYYDDERTYFATGTIPTAIYDRITPLNRPASNPYTITSSDAEKFVHKDGKALTVRSNSIVLQ